MTWGAWRWNKGLRGLRYSLCYNITHHYCLPSWPIRAHLSHREEGLKDTGAFTERFREKRDVQFDEKIIVFWNNEACKSILVDLRIMISYNIMNTENEKKLTSLTSPLEQQKNVSLTSKPEFWLFLITCQMKAEHNDITHRKCNMNNKCIESIKIIMFQCFKFAYFH